jgi:hypothetical protein
MSEKIYKRIELKVTAEQHAKLKANAELAMLPVVEIYVETFLGTPCLLCQRFCGSLRSVKENGCEFKPNHENNKRPKIRR